MCDRFTNAEGDNSKVKHFHRIMVDGIKDIIRVLYQPRKG